MAVASVLSVMLSAQEDANEDGWWKTLLQGVESFFDVERTRNTLLIVLCVAAFIILSRWVLERMLYAPMRMALVEELRSLNRSGIAMAGLDDQVIEAVATEEGSAQDKERRTYQALFLLRDAAVVTRENELSHLSGLSLLSAAAPVKKNLSPSLETYLVDGKLKGDEARALRQVLLEVSREQATHTAIETRLLLRRIRKSQVLATGGALLLVLLVVLFGNAALVAFGVLGAIVSRMISFFTSANDEGQKYNWVILMLTPVVGGLSGFAGVLLVDGMRSWDVLGDVFKDVHFGAESANMATLAAAFLFGFTERLLDSVAGKAVDGLAPIMAEEPTAGGGGVGTSPGGAGGGGANSLKGSKVTVDGEDDTEDRSATDESGTDKDTPGHTTTDETSRTPDDAEDDAADHGAADEPVRNDDSPDLVTTDVTAGDDDQR